MNKAFSTASVVALGLALAACGTSTAERGVSGGAIGAAGGAGLGAVTGIGPGTGAAIGAAAGAAVGALTDEADIDLGEPIWRRW